MAAMGCRGGGLLGLWLFVVVVEVKFMVVVNFIFFSNKCCGGL